jgi:hypothetical protein
LSGLATIRDGRPYNITFGDDRTGTTQRDARPGDRNTGRTTNFRNLDLAAARHIRLGSATLEARAELFNVFNRTNYNTYVGTLSSPLFGQPISAFDKRRVQLAGVLRF